ncbi:kinase-like domain-containing protein [Plectosphaerella plurivora]|uniref:dual-specificity kinase n=1 Tax=Plectosphaerella plurivora TaxID=936078 RepID=A0A9P9ADW5_9PEZI|nr:kinase-like domain-containing protein [Plectosphaerella plurivora]
MSTPTTATATLPPHAHYNSRHTHYPYVYTSTAAAAANAPPSASSPISTQLPHPHAAYYSPSTLAANNTNTAAVTASSNGIGLSAAANAARPVNRTATTANSRLAHDHQEYSPVMPPISVLPTANEPARKKRRSREPDWNKFYKNGLPKEIIVIDDTPEPDATGRSNPSVKVVQQNAAHHTAALAVAAASRPPAKKRKRDDEPQRLDPLHHNKYAGSHHTTPSGSTISTDRTTSSANNTTAATSLSSNGYPYEDPHAGQKRKRTRQQLAQETKKREIEVLGDTCPSYRPPPYPPKKAGEVNVRVIPDNSHSKNVKVDDDDGHYIVVPDADLTDRYQMVQLLGQGTFGKVVKARDRRRGKAVAIKIIRSVQKYRDASRIELRVLQTLKANDDENRNRCIHLRDCFDFRGHICIVMDLLGQSVFDFLKGNNFVPFPNSQIQSFARQLLTSVAFLHDLNLIHTDLKPENILLCDNTYQTFTYNRKIPSSSTSVNRQANQRRVLLDTEIRLIDFGSATFQDEYHSSVVSTRHYRAPEIILGLGWSFPCDIWSIGCILVEFYTGDALFQTHDNLEHLAMMEMVCGSRIDTHLIQGVNKMATRSGGNPAAKYFKRAKLDYPTAETTRASKRFVKAMKRLEDIIPHNNSYFKNFLDLLRKIFVYDPQHRITAKQALAHPWFKEAAHPDDGTEAAKIRLERLRMEQDNSHRLTHGYV